MDKLDMRTTACGVISEMMKNDEKIIVLDADLSGAVGTTSLYKQYPDRTFNVGVAEANMIGVAAGLAAYGFKPLTFTFACFAARRVCDQVALSVAFSKKNVKMFGGDPGITAKINGATHNGNEDISVLRAIPDLMIFEAADCVSLRKLLPQVINYPGPAYTRLLRKDSIYFYDEDREFDLMKIEKVREGSDVTLAAGGLMVSAAAEAAKLLADEGISAEVLDIHTIKPIDAETLVASLRKTGAAVTCENHNVVGGLGSTVAETAAKLCPVPMEFIGVQDHFGEAADLGFLLGKFKMTPADIAEAAKRAISRKLK